MDNLKLSDWVGVAGKPLTWRWWAETLAVGRIGPSKDWPYVIEKRVVLADYRAFARRLGSPNPDASLDTAAGRFLRRTLVGIGEGRPRDGGARPRVFFFPSLHAARESFAGLIRAPQTPHQAAPRRPPVAFEALASAALQGLLANQGTLTWSPKAVATAALDYAEATWQQAEKRYNARRSRIRALSTATEPETAES